MFLRCFSFSAIGRRAISWWRTATAAASHLRLVVDVLWRQRQAKSGQHSARGSSVKYIAYVQLTFSRTYNLHLVRKYFSRISNERVWSAVVSVRRWLEADRRADRWRRHAGRWRDGCFRRWVHSVLYGECILFCTFFFYFEYFSRVVCIVLSLTGSWNEKKL